jgi:hypothetical protein
MSSRSARKPAKGKAVKVKVRNPKTGKKVSRSVGQKGVTPGKPGSKRQKAYCARSKKIKKCSNPPCANDISRKRWKCKN